MERNVKELYQVWLDKVEDESLLAELKSISGNEEKINDAFYRDLAFGTGGLRGTIGAGTNRMNIYTVAKASQGLANYVNKTAKSEQKSIAIGYDSRIKSDLFSQVAAAVYAANGIQVHLYPELMPTPAVSFAIRELQTDAGVMVTASHNPAQYNGYKVYGADGCQIKTDVAAAISEEINKLDTFNDIVEYDFDSALAAGKIKFIEPEVYTAYIEAVKNESEIDENTKINKDVKIIYSPIHGAGLKPVLRALEEMGYTNLSVVKEQELPDGNFPTAPYPNPEYPEAMALGIEYAKREDADMFMATDPDADRLGIAIKNPSGEFELVSGNLVGVLLLDYIIHRKQTTNTMPEHPVFVKTIVTTSLAEKVADSNNVETVNVLTGFKYIGEQIAKLEAVGRVDDYILGFEESYGYLSGPYVRDKDAVNAAILVAEMFSYYMTNGVNLFDKLEEIYDKYGFYLDTLESYQFEGQAGFERMNAIMQGLRDQEITEIAGMKVTEIFDYNKGVDDLPKSDVLKFILGENGSFVVRPSGTEPKLKIYISLKADREEAESLEKELRSEIEKIAGIK